MPLFAGSRVILVRHAKPVVQPQQAAQTWVLEQSAVGPVMRLAETLRAIGADGIVASPEPKAQETGSIIASVSGMPMSIEPDIREQGDGQTPWIASVAEFQAVVAEHFFRPSDVVFGAESSSVAVDRFQKAVNRARLTFQCPILVTHGRILSGYMGRELGVEPMAIWRDLQMPDAFVLDLDAGLWHRVLQEESQ